MDCWYVFIPPCDAFLKPQEMLSREGERGVDVSVFRPLYSTTLFQPIELFFVRQNHDEDDAIF